MNNKVLFIVEGERTEPKFLKAYASKLEIEHSKLEIVSVNTNIFVLYNRIKELNKDFNDSTNTIEVLRSLTSIKQDLTILEDKYPYIYLLFDFEYQDKLHKDKIEILKEMLNYFNDETDNGLLLISYPMIEAYRDFKFKKETIDEYLNRDIEVENIKKYKQIVNERGTISQIDRYTLDNFFFLTKANLIKVNYLINDKKEMPTYEEFITYLNGLQILDKQGEIINQSNKISVLSFALFVYISYFGNKLYQKIEE